MQTLVRSVLAVLAGIAAVALLSEGTDALLRAIGAFPPLDDKASYTHAMFAAATAYRILAGVAGGYVTAALAPFSPLHHAVVLGVVGLALSGAGVIANAINHMGPDWYPITLAATALPSAWFGGRLRIRRAQVHS